MNVYKTRVRVFCSMYVYVWYNTETIKHVEINNVNSMIKMCLV